MTCPDCARDIDHCHGTLVLLAEPVVECTDPDCRDTGRDRHDLVVAAVPVDRTPGFPDARTGTREHHRRRGGEMPGTEFSQHTHEATEHEHEHWHVTHNWSETAGTFEHLASKHSHPHDHAEVEHAHVPHVDFDSEHAGEAHIHDHDEPVGRGG